MKNAQNWPFLQDFTQPIFTLRFNVTCNDLQSSKPIMSEEGKELGLIDALVSPGDLLKVSRLWALDIAYRRKLWIRSLHRTDKLPPLSEARQILKVAQEKAKKTARNLPQHKACLDVIEEGIIHGGYNGVLKVHVAMILLIWTCMQEILSRLLYVFP